jgi:hypothetical protein
VTREILKTDCRSWPRPRMQSPGKQPAGMIRIEHEPQQLIVAAALVVVTAIIQTIGIVVLEDLVSRWRDRVVERATALRMMLVLCGVVLYLSALHVAQMSVWAAFYLRVAKYPSLAVSMYESAMAFTTMDVPELPPAWRFLGTSEGIAGVLMFAWSTGVMLIHTSWVGDARRKYLLARHRISRSDS